MNFNAPLKKLDDVDLPRIGAEIGCGEDELHAVLEVETSGGAADSKGRLKMLFEPHVFYRCLPAGKRQAAVSAGLAYPNWRSGYPADSYPRLLRAMEIDTTAALKACSWGLGQILGENHKVAGYATPQAMVHDFTLDEDNHLEAMVRFMKSKGLGRALARHDWAAFAHGYNGAAYAKHNYHGRLAASFAKWQKIKDTPWDRNAATLTIGGATVDTRSGELGETKAAAPAAPMALPAPGTKPDSPAEVKQLGVIATAIAFFASAWQWFMGSGALRVAIVGVLMFAAYWFLLRPILRRLAVLQDFYARADEIEGGLFIRLRLALKGIKTKLWSWLLALSGMAGTLLQYAEIIDFSSMLPTIAGIPPSLYWPFVAGPVIAFVTMKLRNATTTPVGQTDLALAAPEIPAPPLVPDELPIAPRTERRRRRVADGKRRVKERVKKIRKRARA